MNPSPLKRESRISKSPLREKIEMRINRGDQYPDISLFCQQHGEKITTNMVAHYARQIMGYRRPKIVPRSEKERAKIYDVINRDGIPDSQFIASCRADLTALNERMGR